MTEYLYAKSVENFFRNGFPHNESIYWQSSKGLLDPSDALVFLDNQDLQRDPSNLSTISFREVNLYIMGTSFLLAHTYGIPTLMSSFEYEYTSEGPPYDVYDRISSPHGDDNNSPECINGWVCEHRWKEIKNMIWFKNVVGATKISHWHWFDKNQFAFCRGQNGFIAFSTDTKRDFDHRMYVCVPPGLYCNIMTIESVNEISNCKDLISVDENHFANIFISSKSEVGVIAFHLESKI